MFYGHVVVSAVSCDVFVILSLVPGSYSLTGDFTTFRYAKFIRSLKLTYLELLKQRRISDYVYTAPCINSLTYLLTYLLTTVVAQICRPVLIVH